MMRSVLPAGMGTLSSLNRLQLVLESQQVEGSLGLVAQVAEPAQVVELPLPLGEAGCAVEASVLG